MQSLGYFSAKLAQGISSELENEAEERARGPEMSVAGEGKQLGEGDETLERSSRSRPRRVQWRETVGNRTGRNPGGGKDEDRERETETGRERKGERYGWMGRQRRFQ